MAQQVKPLTVILASHMVLVGVPSSSLLKCLGKQCEDGSSALAPATYMGDLE